MKGQANAYSHTHCQTAQANPLTKVWQRVCLSNRRQKWFLKIFRPFKKNKKRNAQPDRKMTENFTTTMVYRHSEQELLFTECYLQLNLNLRKFCL